MRRTFVPKDDATGASTFALGFTLHQHLHAMGDFRQVGVLTGDDLVQFLDLTGQVGDGFFQLGDAIIGHGRVIACLAACAQRNPHVAVNCEETQAFLAPTAPIR